MKYHDILYTYPNIGDIVYIKSESPETPYTVEDDEYFVKWVIYNIDEERGNVRLKRLEDVGDGCKTKVTTIDDVEVIREAEIELPELTSPYQDVHIYDVTIKNTIDKYCKAGTKAMFWYNSQGVNSFGLSFCLLVLQTKNNINFIKYIPGIDLQTLKNEIQLDIQNKPSQSIYEQYPGTILHYLLQDHLLKGNPIKVTDGDLQNDSKLYYYTHDRVYPAKPQSAGKITLFGCAVDKQDSTIKEELIGLPLDKSFCILQKEEAGMSQLKSSEVPFAVSGLKRYQCVQWEEDVYGLPAGTQSLIIDIDNSGYGTILNVLPDKKMSCIRTECTHIVKFKTLFNANTGQEMLDLGYKWLDQNGFGLGTKIRLNGKETKDGFVIDCDETEHFNFTVVFHHKNGTYTKQLKFSLTEFADDITILGRSNVKSLEVFTKLISIGDEAAKWYGFESIGLEEEDEEEPIFDFPGIWALKEGALIDTSNLSYDLLKKYPDGIPSMSLVPTEEQVMQVILKNVDELFMDINKLDNTKIEECKGYDKYREVISNRIKSKGNDGEPSILEQAMRTLYDRLTYCVSLYDVVTIAHTENESVKIGKEYRVTEINSEDQKDIHNLIFRSIVLDNKHRVSPYIDHTVFNVETSSDSIQDNKVIKDNNSENMEELWYNDIVAQESGENQYDYSESVLKADCKDLLDTFCEVTNCSYDDIKQNGLTYERAVRAYQQYAYTEFCKQNKIQEIKNPFKNKTTKALMDAILRYANDNELIASEYKFEDYMEDITPQYPFN